MRPKRITARTRADALEICIAPHASALRPK
jgi:hypothetical protein